MVSIQVGELLYTNSPPMILPWLHLLRWYTKIMEHLGMRRASWLFQGRFVHHCSVGGLAKVKSQISRICAAQILESFCRFCLFCVRKKSFEISVRCMATSQGPQIQAVTALRFATSALYFQVLHFGDQIMTLKVFKQPLPA